MYTLCNRKLNIGVLQANFIVPCAQVRHNTIMAKTTVTRKTTTVTKKTGNSITTKRTTTTVTKKPKARAAPKASKAPKATAPKRLSAVPKTKRPKAPKAPRRPDATPSCSNAVMQRPTTQASVFCYQQQHFVQQRSFGFYNQQ